MLPSKIGPITGYVNDFSSVISPEKLSELNQLFEQLENKNLAVKQVVTVIFPHREGKELIDIGVELFNTLGIGEKGVNNGLLLLISSEEKKLRIIVGKGLEFIYTDEWCRDLIENHLRPLLNEGKYNELLGVWKDKLENISKEEIVPLKKRKHSKQTKDFRKQTNVVQFLLLLFLFPFVSLFNLFISSIVYGLITLMNGGKSISFFGHGLFFVIFFICSVLFFAYQFYKKNMKIGAIIAVVVWFLIIELFLSIENKNREERLIYCQNNPQICEQQRIERQRKSDSYDSSSHSSGRSSHSSSSSSDFSGGGGSTNGAGAGD